MTTSNLRNDFANLKTSLNVMVATPQELASGGRLSQDFNSLKAGASEHNSAYFAKMEKVIAAARCTM